MAAGRVLFGATVTVDEEGEEKTYSIVGIDETAPGRGAISWVSPLGKALLSKSEGDVVTFATHVIAKKGASKNPNSAAHRWFSAYIRELGQARTQ